MILSPPPLIHKLFGYRKFSETQHKRFELRNFSALETKGFRRKILILPPPLSYSNFFGTRNQCNSKGFPYANFRHCETKNFRRKILILPPPLLSINFFATGNFLKHSTEGFTCETFRQCETKGFRRKIVILPPTHPKTFSLPENFWNTAPKGSSAKYFGTVRQKIFDGKSWHIPLKHKIFRYQKFSETPKVSPTKFFGTVRQNNFDGKSWYPPPLLSLTFFDTRDFLKGSSTKFFGTVRQKFFNGKSWYLLHKVQKSVVKLIFVKTLWKLISKQ